MKYHSYYYPKYADRFKFDRLVVVQCSICGATKVIMPSCLLGEQGVGSSRTKAIISALARGELTQAEIAEETGVSPASVSRKKYEIAGLNFAAILAEIEKLREKLESRKDSGESIRRIDGLITIPKAGPMKDPVYTAKRNILLIESYGKFLRALHPKYRNTPALGLWRIRKANAGLRFIMRI